MISCSFLVLFLYSQLNSEWIYKYYIWTVLYVLHISHVGVDGSMLLHEMLECHNASNTIARLTLVDTAHAYDYFFFLSAWTWLGH